MRGTPDQGPNKAPGQGHKENQARGRGDSGRVRGEERANVNGAREYQAQGLKGDGSRRNPNKGPRA